MKPPNQGFEILDWDSGVFGFPVAKLTPSEDRDALAVALDSARRAGVRLAYLFAENDTLARRAESLNGMVVSQRLTFVRDLSVLYDGRVPLPSQDVRVEQWTATAPTAELLQLGRDAGQYSRFKVDRRIPPGVFERIYDAWILNSVNGQFADGVMVTSEESSLTGLVTLGSRNGRAEIGLIAVSEKARGRGLGKALVNAAQTWAVERRFQEAQVVTQAENAAACRLYASCGYNVERAAYDVHFWF